MTTNIQVKESLREFIKMKKLMILDRLNEIKNQFLTQFEGFQEKEYSLKADNLTIEIANNNLAKLEKTKNAGKNISKFGNSYINSNSITTNNNIETNTIPANTAKLEEKSRNTKGVHRNNFSTPFDYATNSITKIPSINTHYIFTEANTNPEDLVKFTNKRHRVNQLSLLNTSKIKIKDKFKNLLITGSASSFSLKNNANFKSNNNLLTEQSLQGLGLQEYNGYVDTHTYNNTQKNIHRSILHNHTYNHSKESSVLNSYISNKQSNTSIRGNKTGIFNLKTDMSNISIVDKLTPHNNYNFNINSNNSNKDSNKDSSYNLSKIANIANIANSDKKSTVLSETMQKNSNLITGI